MKVISQKGLDLIKSFEGFSPTPYLCPAGILTIGYGTTKGVTKAMKVTEKGAEILLKRDVGYFEMMVESWVKVPLSQNQFDALVSFVYNVKKEAFITSTLLKDLNAGRYDLVPEQIKRFFYITKNGKKEISKGLINRRQKEAELFNTP